VKKNNSTTQQFNNSADIRPVDFSTGSDVVIRVENLSKSYIIGHQSQERYTALRDVLTNGAKNLGKRMLSPFNSSTGQRFNDSTEEFFALKDVSFEIKQGDRVGIIGRNGAGKSTLLKILSRITEPTKGRVTIDGRVASLLEVGTGFHPELTGRENVFLNGAILGMPRVDIKRKFDEIVAFAEVEKFLDTPVKRYSSGMYVRLAFAVAAHLEPEILIVDEVLAVGDAAFQKKCLGKMEEVGKEGRTVLFVSHNMAAVNRLCQRSLFLQSGQIVANGSSEEIINSYLMKNLELTGEVILPADPELSMRLRKISLLDARGQVSAHLEMCEHFYVQVEYDINKPKAGAHVFCLLHNSDGVNVLGSGDADCFPERLEKREKGPYRAKFRVPASLLGEGCYSITVSLGIPYVQVFDRHESIVTLEIVDNNSGRRTWQHIRRPGILGLEIPWSIETLEVK